MGGEGRTIEQSDVLRSKDPAAAVKMLEELVERGKDLLNNKPVRCSDYTEWLNSAREYLIKIFGPRSPNIKTILHAPGKTAVWLGMPDSVHERYRASSIEHRIERLDFCIVRLNSETEMSGGGSRSSDLN